MKVSKILQLLLCLLLLTPSAFAATGTAVFAGGCFWCMQQAFDKVPGVTETTVGFIGGNVDEPSYKLVSSGRTGHYEAIKITYDKSKVDYKDLLTVFWHNIDPVNAHGQFCDIGPQYRAAIFYLDKQQHSLALASKKELIDSKRFPSIVTQILPAKRFYKSEEYHQDYYKKNPVRYRFYKYNCGRVARLKDLWG